MNVALRPEHLDIISLCTGGGGLDLGIELAIPGARSVCMVEREAFAVAQLVSAMEAGLMAAAPIWSDARTFDGRAWRGCVDGLIGGIPCQPHSLAGKRLGEEDERDLWSDARRIIVQSRAWFVVIENVRGMLSSGGAERVWRDLHRLGFEVEGGLFTASEVGASHERERLFILAVADRGGDGQQWRAESYIREIEPRQQASRRSDAERRHSDVGGVGLADAYGKRLERIGADDGTVGRQDARRSAGLRDRATVERASRIGRGEGRPEPELRSGRDTIASASAAVGNATGPGLHAATFTGADRGDEGPRPRHAESQRRSDYVANTSSSERGQIERDRGADTDREESGRKQGSGGPELRSNEALFPPSPGHIAGWRTVLERAPELEPAFRRVADGLASRLDIARVDRLRMLGNGVVPLQAAHAIRSLALTLARRGSSGATKLIRLMEGVEL